jgi:hypothetical protein
VPFYQKVVDARRVARRRLGPVLGTLADPFLRLWLRLRFGPAPSVPPDIVVRDVEAFSPEHDALWEKAGPSYVMCARRDARYLTWKYLRCPHRAYRVREARRAGELVGYAVSREAEHQGLLLGWLVDLFCDTRDEGVKDALLAAVLDGFRRAGVARAQAYTLNRPLADTLRRHGFFPGVSTVQFCVKSNVDPRGAFDDVGGWNLMFGDGDLDR